MGRFFLLSLFLVSPAFAELNYRQIADRSNELYDAQSSLLAGRARKTLDGCYKHSPALPKLINALDKSFRNNLFSDIHTYALHPASYAVIAFDRLDRMTCESLSQRQSVVWNQIVSLDKNLRDFSDITFAALSLSARECHPFSEPDVSGLLERFIQSHSSMRSTLSSFLEKQRTAWMVLQSVLQERGCLTPAAPPETEEMGEPSTVSP